MTTLDILPEVTCPPTDLWSDEPPLESNRHRIAMNVLIRSLQEGYGERDDFYTGGNMFIVCEICCHVERVKLRHI